MLNPQYINVGDFVNDGTGDDLRTAFMKVNENFYDLYLQGGQANTISNVGTGVGIYKEKIGVDLKLKSLKAGAGITLTSNTNDITIESFIPNAIITVNADTGTLTATSGTQALSIVGGSGITTSIVGSTLTITGNPYTLSTDTHPTLNGDLNLNGHNIVGGAGTSVTASHFNGNLTGNVTGLVYGYDLRTIYNEFFGFDFGTISGDNLISAMELYLYLTTVDMGTITSPSDLGLEGGTIV